MEILNNVWIYISPIIASFLTYVITLKSKKKDIDIEKTKKINIIISNLLDVRLYLEQLEKISVINKIDFPFIPKTVPFFFLNSNLLNDNSFKELESSITLLKEYDPITYSDLSGIGNTFEEIKTNFILPFLNSKEQNELTNIIPETYIKDIIENINDYLILVSKNLDRKTIKKVKAKTNQTTNININDVEKEITEKYYNYILKVIPEDIEKPSLEEFTKELNNPEMQELLNEQMKVVNNVDFEELIKIIADTPNISIEEMEKLTQLKPVGNKELW